MRQSALTRSLAPALLGAALVIAGCGDRGGGAPATTRVENDALGVVIADLPEDCEVERNEGAELALACEFDGSPGRLTLEEGEVVGGVNLVELVQAQRSWFEAQPGGEYRGSRELGTPTGPAYTARGRYDEAGAGVEEVRVLALHPAKDDRPLIFRYRYPEGEETQRRVDQLLLLVGEVEALEGASGGDDAAPAPGESPETTVPGG